jgi:hypothetical protein
MSACKVSFELSQCLVVRTDFSKDGAVPFQFSFVHLKRESSSCCC